MKKRKKKSGLSEKEMQQLTLTLNLLQVLIGILATLIDLLLKHNNR